MNMPANIKRNRVPAMSKIIRCKNNLNKTLRHLDTIRDRFKNDTVDKLGFRNFLPEQLKALFELVDIPMPNVTYTIDFTGPYQTIKVFSCGLSWTVMNNNNAFLYIPSMDIFVKESLAVTLSIFLDMLMMLGYNDIPMQLVVIQK